jgi:hypothetical protein
VVDYGGGPGLLGYALLRGGHGIASYTNVDIAQSSLSRTLTNLGRWRSRVAVRRALGPRTVDFSALRPTVFVCVGGVIAHMSDAYLDAWLANVDASGASFVVLEYRKSDVKPQRARRLVAGLPSFVQTRELDVARDFEGHAFQPARRRHFIFYARRNPAPTERKGTEPSKSPGISS